MTISDVLIMLGGAGLIVSPLAWLGGRIRRHRRRARLDATVTGAQGLAHTYFWSPEQVARRAAYDQATATARMRAELLAVYKTVGSQRQRSTDSRP